MIIKKIENLNLKEPQQIFLEATLTPNGSIVRNNVVITWLEKEPELYKEVDEEKFLAENVEDTGELNDEQLAHLKGANPNNY